MSEIPAGWRVSTIGSECQVFSGSTPKTNVSKYWGGEIPWITPKDLSKNPAKFLDSGERFITKVGYESCSTRMVPKGSVLYSSRAPIGYVAIANREMCTNQGFKTAIPSESLDSEFLYYYLQHLTPEIKSRASGTTFIEISGKKFADVPIAVPPMIEQHQIVEILEDHLSRLDAALADVKQARVKAAQFRRSLLHSLMSRATESAGDIADWRITTLGNVSNLVAGKTPPSLESSLEVKVGLERNIPFYKVGDMNLDPDYLCKSRLYLSVTEVCDRKLFMLPIGSVVFPKAGGAIATNKKRIVSISGPIDLNCMAAVPIEGTSSRYLYWWFQSIDLSTYADGSILPQLSKGKMADIPFCLPRLNLQEKLVLQIEESLSKNEEAMKLAEIIERKSNSFRRSLLQAAFTGQLTREAINV